MSEETNVCTYCHGTGYERPENVGTEEEPEIVFAECDMCDSPLDYEKFLELLSSAERKMMKCD